MAVSRHVTLGGLGLLAPPPLLMLMLLLLPGDLHAAHSPLCPCAGPPPHSDTPAPLEEYLASTTTRAAAMSCCGHHLLAAHDPNYHENDTFTIVWSFKGKEYKMVDGEPQKWSRLDSTFLNAHCGSLETLESDGLRVGDEGVYRCHVTSSSGASVTKTFHLCLNRNEDTGSTPINPKISEDTLALLREEVSFTCSAYVGRPRCESSSKPSLTWTKELEDGSWTAAADLPHTDLTVTGPEEGMLRSRLTVHSVQTKHFGRYNCIITKHNESLTLQVTLSKGVASPLRVTGEYRAAVVIMVAAVAFLAAVALVWRRCQMAFALHYRQNKAALSTDAHQQDVFLVHGDSASSWIWSFLLPGLEDSFGYTCFLPQRDMCGGDMIIEETAALVWGSRCVVVVVTPCLLDNPWAAWALHHAVKASLQHRTRILALVLQDLKPQKGLPDTSGILDILRHVRKVPVPRSCRSVKAKPKEPSAATRHRELEWTHKSDSNRRMLKVDTTGFRSRSKSPKDQKLSNMIAASKMTPSDTPKNKKKQKNGGRVIFLEREDSEEPASPCSETPFIFPPASTAGKRGVPRPRTKKPWLSSFLRVLCVRDQKEVFWHTLLGWMGPPIATRQGCGPGLLHNAMKA